MKDYSQLIYLLFNLHSLKFIFCMIQIQKNISLFIGIILYLRKTKNPLIYKRMEGDKCGKLKNTNTSLNILKIIMVSKQIKKYKKK